MLAFKILAAGRNSGSPEATCDAFRWAFAHIKAKDAIVVGIFPKYRDQMKENVEYAIRFGNNIEG